MSLPIASVAVVAACCLLPLTPTAGADTLSSEKAKAAQIEQQIQSTGQQIDALDQQYEGAQAKKSSLDQQISATKTKIAQTQTTIAGDRTTLKKAAVNAYISNGGAATENPLFSGNQSSVAAARSTTTSPKATSARRSPTSIPPRTSSTPRRPC